MHDQGVDCLGSLHNEDQGCDTPGVQVLCGEDVYLQETESDESGPTIAHRQCFYL